MVFVTTVSWINRKLQIGAKNGQEENARAQESPDTRQLHIQPKESQQQNFQAAGRQQHHSQVFQGDCERSPHKKEAEPSWPPDREVPVYLQPGGPRWGSSACAGEWLLYQESGPEDAGAQDDPQWSAEYQIAA